MASAGTVTLNLDANSVKLLRELQKSERASRSTATKMRKEFGAAFKAIALATAAAGAAFGRLAKQSIDAQDRLSKLAQTTGVSTEALSQLEFAAKLSGTSLDGLQTGLLRLSRTASDAANGLSTATRAFDAIGVSAQNQDGTLRDTEQLLLDVAERFAGLEDGAAKAAVAQELFGRSGAQLIPFLNQGKDGIQALREEADKLGLTIGSDAAKAAERFNDNLLRVRSAFDGLIAQSTQAMLPMLEALSDRFVEGVKSTDGMSKAVEQLVTAFKTLLSVAITTYRSLQIAGTAIGGFFAWLVESEFGTKNVNLGVWDDIRAEGQAAADDLFAVWSATATKIEEPSQRIREALNFSVDEGGPGSSIDKLSEDAKRAEQIISATRNEYERFAEAAVEAYALLSQGLIDQEVFDRWLEMHQVRMEEVEAAAEETVERMNQFAIQGARNMQSQFADFLFDPFKDGLKGMLRGFIDTIRRMVAEAAAAQIFGALFPASSGGLGGVLGGFFGGARANGGPVAGGTPYLVGERGPELFVPNSSGMIVPNGAMGGDIVFQIDARGADAQLTRALPAILEQQAQRIKGDIAESMSRRRGLR
jgi:hypothetical protein